MVIFYLQTHMVHESSGWRLFQIIMDGCPCLVFLLKLCDQYPLDLGIFSKDVEILKCEHEAILFFATQLYK